METSKLTIACVAGVLATIGILYPNQTLAKTSRVTYYNATQICQATDPGNFTGLRFRTQGIYNSSNSSIQVACALPREFISDNNTTDIWIFAHNFRTGPATINCSVQAGSRNVGTMNVYPRSFVVQPLDSTSTAITNIDHVTANYTHYAVSCIIPPKLELGLLRVMESDAGDEL
ncbi:hypothetical protein [Luteimonas lutimaris]|uniref:Spore coat protein U domain-containing protein n=1 Tax=Luteimonas lutimaris TaxID=698645 RepID=A0ABP7MWK1_9GAMM